MRCKHCNARLAAHDMWCVKCGKQSPAVVTDLAATRSMRESWQQFKPSITANAPTGALSVILGVLPIMLLIRLFPSLLSFDTNSTIGLLSHLLVKALSISIFFPFLLVGFHTIASKEASVSGKASVSLALAAYPRYLLLSLVSALYYVLIFVICFGLPKFGSDPILRLVWLVLAQYWIVVLLPVPVMMEEHELSFFRALRLSYRHFHVVRWNMYLLLLVLILIIGIPFGISMFFLAQAFSASGGANILLLLPALLFLVPLAVSIPYSWRAVRDYTNRLMEYELLSQ